MKSVSLLLVAAALGGCAVLDPRLPVGAEQGFCIPDSRAPNITVTGLDVPIARLSPLSLACPSGFRRDYGGNSNGTIGLIGNLDNALFYLRDRRRRMENQSRELGIFDAGTRLLAAGGVGAGTGALAFGTAHQFALTAATVAGVGYGGNLLFASSSVRWLLNAGISALSCVEAEAGSAMTYLQTATGSPLQQATLDNARTFASTTLDALETTIAQLEAKLGDDKTPAYTGSSDLAAARKALGDGRQGLAASRGLISPPIIANVVHRRTMEIVNQVNAEMLEATPDVNRVIQIARGSQGVIQTALNDVKGSVQAGAAALSLAASNTGTSPVVAKAGDLQLAGTPNPGGATNGPLLAAADRDALKAKLDAASAAVKVVADAAGPVYEARNSLGHISGCAIQHPGARLVMTVSPAAITIAVPTSTATSTTAQVSGGSGPYQVIRTSGSTITAENGGITTGPIVFTAPAGAGKPSAGDTAQFTVVDFGNNPAAPVTITVTAK